MKKLAAAVAFALLLTGVCAAVITVMWPLAAGFFHGVVDRQFADITFMQAWGTVWVLRLLHSGATYPRSST